MKTMRSTATPVPQGRRVKVPGERNLYVKDGVYYVIVRQPDGGQYSESLGAINLAKARIERDRIVGEVKGGARASISSARLLEVALAWLAEQRQRHASGLLAETTLVAYEGAIRRHILPYFASRKIASIDTDDIASWHMWVRNGGERTVRWYDGHGAIEREEIEAVKTPGTWSVRGYYTALNLLLKYAVRHGVIPSNPCDALTKQERPKQGESRVLYLDRDEIERLLANAPSDVFRLAIAIAVFLGLRLSELRGLRWMDVDLKEGVVYVRGQCDAKGRWKPTPKTSAGYREIALPEFLADMLRRHKLATAFSQPVNYVLSTRNGTAFGPSNLADHALRPAAEKAGVPWTTFHVLRHTFASILIFQGNDVTYVAAQMGHKKASVTLDTYSHLFGRVRNAERHRALLDQEFGHLGLPAGDEPRLRAV